MLNLKDARQSPVETEPSLSVEDSSREREEVIHGRLVYGLWVNHPSFQNGG